MWKTHKWGDCGKTSNKLSGLLSAGWLYIHTNKQYFLIKPTFIEICARAKNPKIVN